ncbi:hypothetical protein OAT33_00385 [Methylophilaceae bacterium]|nr:hypothetical protein [Methylophilaceae bacterium]MDC1173008.1 hypothetical protein [Methylophilaceae bacterium]
MLKHMVSNFNKTLIIIGFFVTNIAYSEVKTNEQKKIDAESAELQQIHDALTEFSQSDGKNSIIYQQKLREMLDSVEVRFHACDPDNDDTLDVYETTVCLPQVARQFRQVDINNDNVISLDELSILARDFAEKRRSIDSAIVKDLNTNKNIISSEKKDEVIKESPL